FFVFGVCFVGCFLFVCLFLFLLLVFFFFVFFGFFCFFFFFFFFFFCFFFFFFFFQAEDGIRDRDVTGVQTCALPICGPGPRSPRPSHWPGRCGAACGRAGRWQPGC